MKCPKCNREYTDRSSLIREIDQHLKSTIKNGLLGNQKPFKYRGHTINIGYWHNGQYNLIDQIFGCIDHKFDNQNYESSQKSIEDLLGWVDLKIEAGIR